MDALMVAAELARLAAHAVAICLDVPEELANHGELERKKKEFCDTLESELNIEIQDSDRVYLNRRADLIELVVRMAAQGVTDSKKVTAAA